MLRTAQACFSHACLRNEGRPPRHGARAQVCASSARPLTTFVLGVVAATAVSSAVPAHTAQLNTDFDAAYIMPDCNGLNKHVKYMSKLALEMPATAGIASTIKMRATPRAVILFPPLTKTLSTRLLTLETTIQPGFTRGAAARRGIRGTITGTASTTTTSKRPCYSRGLCVPGSGRHRPYERVTTSGRIRCSTRTEIMESSTPLFVPEVTTSVSCGRQTGTGRGTRRIRPGN